MKLKIFICDDKDGSGTDRTTQSGSMTVLCIDSSIPFRFQYDEQRTRECVSLCVCVKISTYHSDEFRRSPELESLIREAGMP